MSLYSINRRLTIDGRVLALTNLIDNGSLVCDNRKWIQQQTLQRRQFQLSPCSAVHDKDQLSFLLVLVDINWMTASSRIPRKWPILNSEHYWSEMNRTQIMLYQILEIRLAYAISYMSFRISEELIWLVFKSMESPWKCFHAYQWKTQYTNIFLCFCSPLFTLQPCCIPYIDNTDLVDVLYLCSVRGHLVLVDVLESCCEELEK